MSSLVQTGSWFLGPIELYTIKWSESTEGIKECLSRHATIGCYFIDINPEALGADTVSAMDFKGNTFTMAKIWQKNAQFPGIKAIWESCDPWRCQSRTRAHAHMIWR